MNDTIFIDELEALRGMCRNLETCKWLAVDTEFIRERSYYPKLALVQLASDSTVYCVDPLTIADISPLIELLHNDRVTKVFHAGLQDLECFFHLENCIPTPIFDTQVAAGLLGLGEQIGYGALVKRVLGVTLDKSQSRTDWMKRPLGEAQLQYAADDVRYLSALYPVVVERLQKLDRLTWMEDELDYMTLPSTYEPAPAAAWRRIRGIGKLNRRQLNTVKYVAEWREYQAMKSDRPRRWIVSDDALANLAMQHPTDRTQLSMLRMLDAKTVKRHGAALLALIAKADKTPEERCPQPVQSRRPSASEEAALDMLMVVVRIKAEEHRLSPGQIASRSELLQLVRGETELPLLTGWRYKIAGKSVMETFSGAFQLVCDHGRPTLILTS